MRRRWKVALYVVLVGAALAPQVAPLALWRLPTAWGYTLTPACYWTPRPWAQHLGSRPPPARPDRAGRRAEWACLQRRGLKSMIIFGAHIEQRWPNPATIARWETEDAHRQDPLPADWTLAPDPDALRLASGYSR